MNRSAVGADLTRTTETPDLLARRRATIGAASPTFYDEPLELVSGSGVWLTDARGARYLDGYNNVPHVGHANPVVADAVCRQMRTINLSTRYLHTGVVDCAEALLAHFDGDLRRVAFTNSGSESNDLALRMARQHTGNTGVLVSDWSYHGNTASLAELTTGLAFHEPFGQHVRALHIPDGHAVGPDDEECLLQEALSEVDRAISSLDAAGHGVSAVLFDPLFSTEGLVRPPAGYVEGLALRVRAAGGMVIADEVQSGFGRIGSSMWGYQMYGVQPDLVVLGKPMGNGHPISAVVTTEELLEEFGARNDYFNTFAGTPVSAAAALAVLRVVREDGLMGRAEALGRHVGRRLRAIADGDGRVRAVRGRGLYFGLELVDPHDGRADAALTKELVEDVRRRGALISRIGPDGNVLKMRPPMVITQAEIDLLVDLLQRSLDASTRS